MEVYNGSVNNGAAIVQRTYSTKTYQQWNVTPVDSRIGGDFSYFSIVSENSGKYMENLNYSLDNNSITVQNEGDNSAKQQWYFDYADDGWFYIRNRESAKCLQVLSPYVLDGISVVQNEKSTSGIYQQWRLIPVGAPIEFTAPAAPTGLTATANASSVRLDWTANTETDLSGYTIFRADEAGGAYNTIGRDVKSNSFVDNTAVSGKPYFYAIRAVDNSLNRSAYSNEVSATASGNHNLVMKLEFENNTKDSTENLNNTAFYGTPSYGTGKIGSKSLLLMGVNTFAQVPPTVANHEEITFATWVYWLCSTAWQRIFDFGNSENEYMFLTPKSGAGTLRFGIKNNGSEQILETSALPKAWTHVAVTLANGDARMYVNGNLVAQSNSITIHPNDIKPVLNYIGRSQFSDPLFVGYIDDFRVYNYALTADNVNALYNGILDGVANVDYNNSVSVYPTPANNIIHIKPITADFNSSFNIEMLSIDGKVVKNKFIQNISEAQLNVSDLEDGIYLLKINSNSKTAVKKIIIKH